MNLKRFKKTVFNRDGHECLKCGTKQNLTIDHIVPQSLGGHTRAINLQTLCEGCNMKKGASVEVLNNKKRSMDYARRFNMSTIRRVRDMAEGSLSPEKFKGLTEALDLMVENQKLT